MVETWIGLEDEARQVAKELASIVEDASAVNREAAITGVVNHALAELDSSVSVLPRIQTPESVSEIKDQALGNYVTTKRLTVRQRLDKATEQATVIGLESEEIQELRRDIIRGAASRLSSRPLPLVRRS